MPTLFLRHVCLAAMLGAAAGAALASTPEAWAAHDAEAKARCVAMSPLKRAKASGRPVLFDDTVGYTAVLVAGRHATRQRGSMSGRVLCLYDRRTGTAHIAEADRMGSPRH